MRQYLNENQIIINSSKFWQEKSRSISVQMLNDFLVTFQGADAHFFLAWISRQIFTPKTTYKGYYADPWKSDFWQKSWFPFRPSGFSSWIWLWHMTKSYLRLRSGLGNTFLSFFEINLFPYYLKFVILTHLYQFIDVKYWLLEASKHSIFTEISFFISKNTFI